MLVLTRKGSEVTCDGKKLTIVAQATKGPGKECVKIEGLAGSNGQKWISLARLKEGENKIECQAKEVTSSGPRGGRTYELTADEAAKVAKLQGEIDAIIAAAKTRFVPKPKLDVDPTQLTKAERQAKIAEIIAFYGGKLTSCEIPAK